MEGKEDTYHWALSVGPKSDNNDARGVRYHARDRATQEADSAWAFEEAKTSMTPT
ncbi:unnamed protein product, partial [Aureobasidium uvarum]